MSEGAAAEMNVRWLERLIQFHAVVGNEAPLAEWLMEQVAPHATRVESDRIGNLFAWRGEQPRVALFSHMDSVGFIVEEVHEGHVKVMKMGNPHTPTYTPMVLESEQGEPLTGTLLEKNDKLFIDLWDAARTEAVAVGDLAAFAPNFRVEDGLIHSRWLDNKLGVWLAFEAWKRSKEAIFVATVREEHAPHGAGAALQRLPELEVAVVVDITFADGPTTPYMIEWGKGPAVTYRDAHIYDRRWAKRMLHLAEECEIAAQPEIAASGGSDARHIAQGGVPAIFVGVPIRYAHTPAEVARLADCEATRRLLQAFLAHHHAGTPL